MSLLSQFRSSVAEPDAATADRVYRLATSTRPPRRQRRARRLSLVVAAAAAVITGGAVAAVTLLGQPAPKSVQANIHHSAVVLFPPATRDSSRQPHE
jgi:hypothetical protein